MAFWPCWPKKKGNMLYDSEHELRQMVAAYLDCAAWADAEEGMQNLPFADQAWASARADCADFLAQAKALVADLDPEQVGHDLWLTRNRHGVGFWDRDLGAVGDALTLLARAMGERWVYEEHGELYLS